MRTTPQRAFSVLRAFARLQQCDVVVDHMATAAGSGLQDACALAPVLESVCGLTHPELHAVDAREASMHVLAPAMCSLHCAALHELELGRVFHLQVERVAQMEMLGEEKKRGTA